MENINKNIIEIALQRCSDPTKLEDFLFPEKIDLKDPFGLNGVKESCERIKKAIKNEEKILIYGDYDADGITSTALLYRGLTKIHDRISYYIPQRDGEGYGLNHEALNKILNQKTDLIITVDCGIKSYDLVKEFTEKGMDFIITDHHIPDELIPDAIIVNPKLSGEESFLDLAGVGVAYTIASALGKEFPQIKEIDSDLLQLAAIGTVADLVNLSMENRKIVRKGIIALNRTPFKGIKSLVDKNDITEINSKTISFLLAPIINSSGRMESPEIALKLLISDDVKETDSLAEDLIHLNNKRKTLVDKVYKEAQKIILENNYFSDPIIIIEKENWPQGILGIVASKLLNEYNRSIILFTESEEGIYKGSARSIEKYNIFDALKKNEDIIDQFGGHAQAAGLSILKDNINILRDKLKADIYQNLNHTDFYNDINSDADLEGISEITEDLYRDLALLEPFGTGNPEPIFKFIRPVDLKIRKIGKLQDHLRIEISEKRNRINGVYFNYQEYPGEEVKSNLFFSLGINEWRNKVSLQLEVKKIIDGQELESQKMEQRIYSNLLFSNGKLNESFTTTERIKYNDVWDILENSKGIIYSKEQNNLAKGHNEFLNKQTLLYKNEKQFPDNFKDIKKFIRLEEDAVLITNSLLLKKEILIETDVYIFADEEPNNNMLYFIKNINPNIKIFIVEDANKRNDLSREILSQFYLMIKEIYSSSEYVNLSEIESFIEKKGKIKMTTDEIIIGVMIFDELGFLEYALKNKILEIKFNLNPDKTNLENSRLYLMSNYK